MKLYRQIDGQPLQMYELSEHEFVFHSEPGATAVTVKGHETVLYRRKRQPRRWAFNGVSGPGEAWISS